MNEVVETLRKIEQNYKLFQQQQFTFTRALDRTREEARDLIKPVATIVQVQCYKDHHCFNLTDKRILNMFITICNDLRDLCRKVEMVHPGDQVSNAILEKCKLLLNDSNDLSAIRAKYPHGVVNYLSFHEAKHFYGGVVSLIPIVIDHLKEWVTYTKRKMLHEVSPRCAICKKEAPTSQKASAVHLAARPCVCNKDTVQLQEKDFQKFLAENQRPKKQPPWRPPGKHP
ncbi:SACA9 protein, partial [Neodrepanis coruscans]|nr:SACA9 protein [Neodrepanis coruscans]